MVNSGQLSQRFSFSFFFFLLSHNTPPQPTTSLGSHRCWQWRLWNELSPNEAFSLGVNPSAWQQTTALSASSGFVSLCPISKNLQRHCSRPVLFPAMSALHALVCTSDCGKALRGDITWALFFYDFFVNIKCGQTVLLWMICCLMECSLLQRNTNK